MFVYKIANKTAVKDIPKGTHRDAVLKALGKLKEATSGEIVDFVKKNRLLRKSKMDPAKAIQWIVGQMAKDGQILKAEKEAAA